MADDTNTADTQQAPQPAAASAAPPATSPPPKDWDGFKAWIRKELSLAGQGLTDEEREALNP